MYYNGSVGGSFGLNVALSKNNILYHIVVVYIALAHVCGQCVICGYIIFTAAGRIKAIYQRSGSKLTRSSQLYLKLTMFYRPEDTHRGAATGREADLCLLYWGDEGETLGVAYSSVT